MFNPFEEELSEHSQEPTALPVSIEVDPHTASPISFLQLEHLAQGTDIDPRAQRRVKKFLSETKGYAESLQQRNLEIACELQKERNKNKQLMSALTFLMSAEEERNKNFEERIGRMTENNSKLQVQQNRRQMVESEVKSLRLENSYLKDLILIANDNYEKLQEKNRQIIDKYANLEQESHKKEIEMIRKTEEIKEMFAALVTDRGQERQRQKDMMSTQGTQGAVQGCAKGGKKEQAEDAYRSIFMKTLKPRKENVYRQA